MNFNRLPQTDGSRRPMSPLRRWTAVGALSLVPLFGSGCGVGAEDLLPGAAFFSENDENDDSTPSTTHELYQIDDNESENEESSCELQMELTPEEQFADSFDIVSLYPEGVNSDKEEDAREAVVDASCDSNLTLALHLAILNAAGKNESGTVYGLDSITLPGIESDAAALAISPEQAANAFSILESSLSVDGSLRRNEEFYLTQSKGTRVEVVRDEEGKATGLRFDGEFTTDAALKGWQLRFLEDTPGINKETIARMNKVSGEVLIGEDGRVYIGGLSITGEVSFDPNAPETVDVTLGALAEVAKLGEDQEALDNNGDQQNEEDQDGGASTDGTTSAGPGSTGPGAGGGTGTPNDNGCGEGNPGCEGGNEPGTPTPTPDGTTPGTTPTTVPSTTRTTAAPPQTQPPATNPPATSPPTTASTAPPSTQATTTTQPPQTTTSGPKSSETTCDTRNPLC